MTRRMLDGASERRIWLFLSGSTAVPPGRTDYLFDTPSTLGVRRGEAPTAVAARRGGTSPRWSSSRLSPGRSIRAWSRSTFPSFRGVRTPSIQGRMHAKLGQEREPVVAGLLARLG